MDNAFLDEALKAHAEFEQMSGLEYMLHSVRNGASYPFAKLLGMRLVHAEDGHVILEAEPQYEFYNPMNRIHGGWLASLMDSTLGSSVLTKLGAGVGAGTVQLSVNYVRKVSVESGILTAEAWVKHAGRSLLTSSAEIRDSSGALCVHGTGTFLPYQK
jgi:uncharacterized protein (TIGR00369 family)